jgi:hypothetical protein
VRDASWSGELAKLAVWLYGHVEDDLAEQIMLQVGGIGVSDTSIWRRMKKWGEKIKALEAARVAEAMVVVQHGGVVRGEGKIARRMGVAMDGAMVAIREEGWKELKVGCVFEVEKPCAVSGEGAALAHAVNNSYAAILGGPQRFGQAIWAEAKRRQFPRAPDSVVLGDGAPWIWNLTREHFGYSRQAVDWYHAKEHLYKAASVAFGEGTAEAKRWAKGMETPLYQGQVWQLVRGLNRLAEEHPQAAHELRKQAGYFEHNKRRMQYMELREDGFPIGSGMVESGCKRFRARLTGSGMRWSRPGAERLIPVRAAILSERFDEVWSAAYNLPPT